MISFQVQRIGEQMKGRFPPYEADRRLDRLADYAVWARITPDPLTWQIIMAAAREGIVCNSSHLTMCPGSFDARLPGEVDCRVCGARVCRTDIPVDGGSIPMHTPRKA